MKIPKKEELENKDELYLYERDTDKCDNFNTLERINKIIDLLEKHSSGKKVLDIGSAQGNAAILAAERGFDSVALDLNKNFLNYARKKQEFGNVSYACANALKLPFKNNTFDAAIMGELIEHVAYPEQFIKEAKRCLKKGGLLAITTPNNHLFSGLFSGNRPILFSNLNKADRKKLLKNQFGPSGSDHLFVFDMESLKELVKINGLKVVSSGYTNPFFVNKFAYPIFKYSPKSIKTFLSNIATDSFLKSKFSMSLYALARK